MKKIMKVVFIIMAFVLVGCQNEPTAITDAYNAIVQEFNEIEVYDDIKFPSSIGEIQINYYSDNRFVLENDGRVNRGDEDVVVKVKVVFTLANIEYAKDITVKVIGKNQQPTTKYDDVVATLDSIIALNNKKINSDLNLITTSVHQSTIAWTSSNTEIISNSGKVTLPTVNTTCTLTCQITIDGIVYDPLVISLIVTPKVELTVEGSENLELTVGEQAVIAATVNVDGYNIVWDTSDSGILSINAGIVKALKVGSVVVTVSIEELPTIQKQITIHVNEKKEQPTISVNVEGVLISVDQTITIVATVDQTGYTIVYTSDNPLIATVNNGIVTGLKAGVAIISVSLKEMPQVTSLVRVEVLRNEPVITVSETTVNMSINEQKSVTISVNEDYTLQYIISDDAIISFDDGIIKGLKAGTATILVKVEEDEKVTATITVTVEETIFTPQITVNKDDIVLNVDDVFDIIASVNGATYTLNWEVDNKDIISLDKGSIRGLAKGEANVTISLVEDPTVKKVVKVTVLAISISTDEFVTEVLVNKDFNIIDELNIEINYEGSELVWLVDDNKIATIEDGILDPIKSGKVTVTIISNITENSAIEIDVYICPTQSVLDYYKGNIIVRSSAPLKASLRTLITTTHKKYTTYDNCKTMLQKADADPNNSNNLILFYARQSVKKNWDSGATWNREHVWPQSQGWFSTSLAGSDLHHIRPTDASINSTRSNKPYGECPTGKAVYYKKTNTLAGKYTTYFEPLDEVKGDVARIIFYLLTHYKESDNYRITNVAQSMEMLLRWNELDPIDQFEIDRNNYIYTIQGNRNPFIDFSSFANDIWDN